MSDDQTELRPKTLEDLGTAAQLRIDTGDDTVRVFVTAEAMLDIVRRIQHLEAIAARRSTPPAARAPEGRPNLMADSLRPHRGTRA